MNNNFISIDKLEEGEYKAYILTGGNGILDIIE